jgi:PKD repeat protein
MKFFVSLLAVVVLFICSCKKKSIQEILQGDATAQFSVGMQCQNYLLPTPLQLLDSTVIFSNSSHKIGTVNTSELMSYLWNFGDNSSSNTTNPIHKYNKSGNYSIQLIVFLNGQPVDTATQSIGIIIGQKEFKTSMAYNDAIDIAETTDKGALILLQTYDNVLNRSYSLLKIDSVLRQQWIKPLGGINIRLNSIKQLNATEYILSGNLAAGNINQFSISKIDNQGNLIWTKYVSGMQGINTFTSPTADGGFITVGSTTIGGFYNSAVVKLNASGDEMWRNVLSGFPWYTNPDNILEIGNRYIFASHALTANNRVLITQLNSSGTTIREDSIPTNPISSPFTAGILYAGNNFMVYETGTNMVYLLDNSFALQASKEIIQSQITSMQAKDNTFYITASGTQYGTLKSITPIGTENWNRTIDNVIPTSCTGSFIGAKRRCKKVIYTSYNEIIALSDGQNDINNGPSSSTYVVKFAVDGSVK